MSEIGNTTTEYRSDLVVPFEVGEDTIALVSKMREPVDIGQEPSSKLLVGDILRRTCQLGGTACAESGCQVPDGYVNRIDKLCSDMNLSVLTDGIGLAREQLLMVSVTKNRVGFYDEIRDTDAVSFNSAGIPEVVGYNAFFSRDSEDIAIGGRLADCGFVALEFPAADGETVRGITHLSRPNMQGNSALRFDVDGNPAGSFEYFLHEALKHYGSNVEDVKVQVTAAIRRENFPHTFADEETLEKSFPGWWADGLMDNVSSPDWRPGDKINPQDIWLPEFRGMVMQQILSSGVSANQITTDGMIDPGDLELGHASNHAGAHGKMPDARDAYIVAPRRLID